MTTGSAMGSISSFTTRLSLRWVPGVPEETTDTVVLTVGDWFVDLRMDKKSGAIDWAMAGTAVKENPNETPGAWPPTSPNKKQLAISRLKILNQH